MHAGGGQKAAALAVGCIAVDRLPALTSPHFSPNFVEKVAGRERHARRRHPHVMCNCSASPASRKTRTAKKEGTCCPMLPMSHLYEVCALLLPLHRGR